MAPFDIKEVREMMEGDELELDKIGDRKTALFCIVSDTDMTFNFISAIPLNQFVPSIKDLPLGRNCGPDHPGHNIGRLADTALNRCELQSTVPPGNAAV